MSAPKSVVKMSKNGITYTSNIDAAQYFIHELSRAAMRDVGKFIRRKWQEGYDAHFGKRTGEGRKATGVKVIANAKTEHPRVQVGLKKSAKGFYAYYQEFGTRKPNAFGVIVPKLGLLTHATEDNIAEIVKIESQYLSALSGETEALASQIDEEEYDDDIDI